MIFTRKILEVQVDKMLEQLKTILKDEHDIILKIAAPWQQSTTINPNRDRNVLTCNLNLAKAIKSNVLTFDLMLEVLSLDYEEMHIIETLTHYLFNSSWFASLDDDVNAFISKPVTYQAIKDLGTIKINFSNNNVQYPVTTSNYKGFTYYLEAEVLNYGKDTTE